MTVQSCGFKKSGGIEIQHKLPKTQKAAEKVWTTVLCARLRHKATGNSGGFVDSVRPLRGSVYQNHQHEHRTTTGGATNE